jgi:hypothetical protein
MRTFLRTVLGADPQKGGWGDRSITTFEVSLCDRLCNKRSRFAAKREKGQASLFSFGVGKVGDDGRVPIPESHNKEERVQRGERGGGEGEGRDFESDTSDGARSDSDDAM